MKKNIYFLIFSIMLLPTLVFSEETLLLHFSDITKQAEENAFSHAKTAKSLVVEMQAIAAKYPDNISLTIQTLYTEAIINYYQLINDSILLSKSTVVSAALNTEKYPFEHTLLNYTLALCHSVDGNYADAFSLALKSLEQFNSMHKTLFASKVYYLLGNICLATQSRKEAREYYSQALATAVHGQRNYYLPFIAMYSNMVYEQVQKNAAMDSLTCFVEQYNNSHPHFDAGILATACFNLGTIYYIAENKKEGERFYSLCKQHVDTYNIDNHTLLYGLNYNFSELFTQNGDYVKALEYSCKANKTAIDNNSLVQRSYILFQTSAIYDSMYRHNHISSSDSAYKYLSQYVDVHNQIIGKSQTIDSYKAYITIYMESLQKELTIAVQQRHRTMLKRIEQDKHIQKLQEDKIEAQKRELSGHALLLSEKNTLLQQIDSYATALPADNKEAKAIKQIVRENIITEQAWHNFMIHFNEVHPDFFDKLKEHTPLLTENNLRLCAYLRISMTSKQIAQVLNISSENVRKSTYRLKKKLLLGEHDNLYDFLRRV